MIEKAFMIVSENWSLLVPAILIFYFAIITKPDQEAGTRLIIRNLFLITSIGLFFMGDGLSLLLVSIPIAIAIGIGYMFS
jgi:hypothetical protein